MADFQQVGVQLRAASHDFYRRRYLVDRETGGSCVPVLSHRVILKEAFLLHLVLFLRRLVSPPSNEQKLQQFYFLNEEGKQTEPEVC